MGRIIGKGKYIIIIIIAVVVSIILIYTINRTPSIGGFEVLSGVNGEDSIYHGTVSIREIFLKNQVRCKEGDLVSISSEGISYIFLCKVYKAILSNTMILNNSSTTSFTNTSPTDIVINGSYRHTVLDGVPNNYRRAWNGKFHLKVHVPSSARQGIVPVGNNYYSIANIPYIFLRIRYLRGLGNASLFVRVIPSINSRNLSSPYVIEYSLDSNETLFLSPVEFPIHRSTLEEDHDKLGPLLDVDADHTVDLCFYIEVYVRATGDFSIELEIGYPGIRVIGE